MRGQPTKREEHKTLGARVSSTVIFSKLLGDKIIAVFAQLQKVIKSRQWHGRKGAARNEALILLRLCKKNATIVEAVVQKCTFNEYLLFKNLPLKQTD